MYYSDILLLMLSAVLANHLGLVEAVEGVIRHKIPVLNCPMCASFWVVLVYSLIAGRELVASVAVSFMCAYIALWLELLCGYIDTLYNRFYESIYTSQDKDETDTQD